MKHANQGLVLCYNLSGNKAAKIKASCIRLGLRLKTVSAECFALPLGHLLHIPEYEQTPPTDEAPFHEEMLVFYNLSQSQLDALLTQIRTAGGIRLKAVVTPTNVGWTSCALNRELQAERAAISRGQGQAHTPNPDA